MGSSNPQPQGPQSPWRSPATVALRSDPSPSAWAWTEPAEDPTPGNVPTKDVKRLSGNLYLSIYIYIIYVYIYIYIYYIYVYMSS
jgi:hypothetical protein